MLRAFINFISPEKIDDIIQTQNKFDLITNHKVYIERATSSQMVLFLDFDGVIHPGNSGSLRYMGDFESLMKKYPQIDIIISIVMI